MRKLNLFLLIGVGVALMPAVGWAGAGTGACFVVTGEPALGGSSMPLDAAGGFNLAGCADGFTLEQCSSVDELTEFLQGVTCADVAEKGGISWQGSCQASIEPVGGVCIQLWTVQGAQATQGLCLGDIGGEWFTDLECGGTPVPTMPPVGLAALMLLMLAGALFFMAKRSPLTSV
jgi:hypothetical protein